nr:dual specificity protein phosphatase 12 isoform X2 [Anser cygnoides]
MLSVENLYQTLCMPSLPETILGIRRPFTLPPRQKEPQPNTEARRGLRQLPAVPHTPAQAPSRPPPPFCGRPPADAAILWAVPGRGHGGRCGGARCRRHGGGVGGALRGRRGVVLVPGVAGGRGGGGGAHSGRGGAAGGAGGADPARPCAGRARRRPAEPPGRVRRLHRRGAGGRRGRPRPLPGRGEPQRGRGDRLPHEDAGARLGGGVRCCQGCQARCRGQLKLYEAMGCTVDSGSALYKRYRLQMLRERYPELQDLPREVFADDPTNMCQTLNTEVLYRCRKCRRSLFRSSSILSHVEGDGPTAFVHKRITESAQLCGGGPDKCTSYFIEPVQWMEPALLGVMEGQLLCPKCTSKLGSFSWRGEQCSCGRWVTPAFQIHKSRVDEVRTLPVGNLLTAKT